MDCVLSAILACLTWSNVYVSSGLSYQDVGIPRQEWRTRQIQIPGGIETATTLETDGSPVNPYGYIAGGLELNIKKLRFSVEARHGVSSLRLSDRGINSINLQVAFFPFR